MAGLLALGKSDPDIAAEPLPRRTVQTHVSHILAERGARSRWELGARSRRELGVRGHPAVPDGGWPRGWRPSGYAGPRPQWEWRMSHPGFGAHADIRQNHENGRTMPATVPDHRMRAIYDCHSGALLRTLLNWTYGDWQAAEDLMQETMMRAWRHLDTLDPDPHALRPWLFTVARRIAIDRFRAREARPPETEPETLEQVAEPVEPLERLLDRETLLGALRGLSEAHRSALIHVYLMDCTVPEAARSLGVPEGTVKSRLHHGLRAVRSSLL